VGLRVLPLVESRFRLDGGAMFGVVPRALWGRTFTADEQNRIELVCRLLLVEARDFLALVDTGMGQCWGEGERTRFALRSLSLEEALAAHGHRPDEITDVVLTHLHFDHAGGVAREDGAPRFGGAVHHVQRENFEWARNPPEKERASYRRQTLEALERVQLRLLDGAGPVLPGVRASVSSAHTTGLQTLTIESENGPVVFCADLVPTRAHVPLPWIMAYDNHPLAMSEEKRRLYAEVAESGGVLVLEHDPEVEAVRVRRLGEQWTGEPITLPR
jgi:glyoxylase-like metal-dependent hydrolase (beta-lactamase superfamily II)